MQEFLNTLVRALVDDKEAVTVEIVEEASTFQIKIRVAEADCGTVVGKSGATIKAIRELLGIYQRKLLPNSFKRIFISVNE